MAIIMDGRGLAEKVKKQVREEIERIKKAGTHPTLYSILIGDDEASKAHIQVKTKAFDSVGIKHITRQIEEGTLQHEVENFIYRLNNRHEVNGIMIQLPLPPGYDKYGLIDTIGSSKDVDGLTPVNIAGLHRGTDYLEPCTLKGIMSLLDHYDIDPRGKDVAILGSRGVVGKPLSFMMMEKGATVQLCHSETNDLLSKILSADIVVTAVGRPHYVTADMVKEGAVVIDVGENRLWGKIVGDVDFENVKEKAGYITPVPGGVGPMNVASLMQNVVKACCMQGADIPF